MDPYEDDLPLDDDDELYEPGLVRRLSKNRALLLVLVIAFLLLIVGSSLYYILRPYRPRLPFPIQRRAYPAESDDVGASSIRFVAAARTGTTTAGSGT